MTAVGARCHESRINDEVGTWRVMYRIDRDAVGVLEVFAKKTGSTPNAIIKICQKRLREYDHARK